MLEEAGTLKPRLAVSHPDLDRAEGAWWSEFGDVEERFCWVQPRWVQQRLRGSYVRRIRQALPPDARILEFGCGTGWLATMLAEEGACRVTGVDFSPSQVARARDAQPHDAPGKVRFETVRADLSDLAAVLSGEQYDALLLHGVLHHMSDREVEALLSVFVSELAAPRSKIVVLEPVLYRPDFRRPAVRAVNRWIDRLIRLPLMGGRLGIRRVTAEEALLRHRVETRGPSPKETPFVPGQLAALLQGWTSGLEHVPVLAFSYLAAKNLLLMELSHPVRARLLGGAYLRLLSAFDRLVLRSLPDQVYLPVFELWIGTLRSVADA